MSKPAIDFDHQSAYYAEHWQEIARDLHATGNPIAWSEHHEGFWVLADVEQIHRVASDWETFTSDNDVDGTGNGGRGQVIPQLPFRLFLGESDPPFHTDRRRLEAPFFTPKALRRWGPVVHQNLDEAIDLVIEHGRADLVDDIIVPTTARTTLFVLGYDPDDWQDTAAVAHTATNMLPSDPGYPHAEQERLRVHFRELLQARREIPTGDIITSLTQGTVQGERLTDDEAESMMWALVFGGFDTTAALTANAMIWISRHPEMKSRFVEDEAFRKNAIEEFLRIFPPTPLVARTAVRDTEILGHKIKRGERVAMWVAGANRDPKVFDAPDELRLDRSNARDHVSFSAGHHRCLGSPLAKVEINTMLTTILERMPDVTVQEEGIVKYRLIGSINGFVHVPTVFTPGTRTQQQVAGVSEGENARA